MNYQVGVTRREVYGTSDGGIRYDLRPPAPPSLPQLRAGTTRARGVMNWTNWAAWLAIGFGMLTGVTLDRIVRNVTLFGWHLDRWIGPGPIFDFPLIVGMVVACYIGLNAMVNAAYRAGRQDVAADTLAFMETVEVSDAD